MEPREGESRNFLRARMRVVISRYFGRVAPPTNYHAHARAQKYTAVNPPAHARRTLINWHTGIWRLLVVAVAGIVKDEPDEGVMGLRN